MRCYNGCPDSELKKVIEDEEKAYRKLEKLGVRATYFPMEGKYMGFKDLKPVTEFCNSIYGVLYQVEKSNKSNLLR